MESSRTRESCCTAKIHSQYILCVIHSFFSRHKWGRQVCNTYHSKNTYNILNYIQGVSYWRVQSKSALRGRRINHCIDLWCLVASGGLHICVSSDSFQKNDIDRPQRPPTKQVPKFNMTYHDSTQKTFFQNIKKNAKFKCLNDPEVLSRDFPGP